MSKEKNIKSARHSRGMTQEQAAHKSGVTLRTFIRYESANRLPKDCDKRARVCKALGLTEVLP